MSININNQPTQYSPLHSPMMFLVDSTLNAEINMKVVFTITVGGKTRNVKVSPRPGDQKIEFDISKHLRDYLDMDGFVPTTAGPTVLAPSVSYTVNMHEEHIDGVSGVLTIGSNTADVDYVATNIVLNRSEQLLFIEDKWVNDKVAGSPASNILLNSHEESTYYTDDVIWVHMVGLGYDAQRKFRIREYNASGIVIHTHPIYQMTVTSSEALYYKLDLSTIVLQAATVKIGLQVLADDGGALTNENKYKVVERECLPYENMRLIYMDKLGSYNTISLNYMSHENLEIEKKNFRKRIDSLSDGSYTRGLQSHFTRATERYTLNTGNLNRYDMAKFEDMLLSTKVLLDVRANDDVKFDGMTYVPLMINTNTMKRFNSVNGEIAQYTVECELGFEKNVRRR